MREDLTSSQLLLEEYMSEISERCYSAGWMENLEYALWHALINGPRKYGHGLISQKDIQTLIDLSNRSNTWIIFDDETEETAMDLDAWKQKFQRDVENNPGLISIFWTE